jgi:hypothetical protein
MYYQLFLQTLTQLSSKGTAILILENGTIYIQSVLGNDKWRISTPLFKGNGHIPEALRSCVSSRGNLHWQKSGAYLQLEASTQTLSLIDEMEIMKDKYLSFKKHIRDFIELSQEWKEIFDTH